VVLFTPIHRPVLTNLDKTTAADSDKGDMDCVNQTNSRSLRWAAWGLGAAAVARTAHNLQPGLAWAAMPEVADADWRSAWADAPPGAIIIDWRRLESSGTRRIRDWQAAAPRAIILGLLPPDTTAQKICSLTNSHPGLRWMLLQPRIEETAQAVLNLVSEAAATTCSDVPDVVHMELDRLAHEAHYDKLTGLLRREAFSTRAEEELARATRASEGLCVIMADIDHFKRVNDVFGHPVGDRALRRVARLLEENRRPYDLVGRYGGEEFVLLCPAASADAGVTIAERLRQRIECYAWEEEALPNLTISLGVAEWTRTAPRSLDDLIKLADEGLYQAKRLGRNQVCVGGGSSPAPAPQSENAAQGRPRILIVDDTHFYLDQLVSLLSASYRVTATSDSAQALQWIQTDPFAVALIDQNMPGVDGTDLLARLKAVQPDCLRILMTAHGELSAAIHAINHCEVYRFLLKPWRTEEVLLMLHQALEQQAMVRRLRTSDRDTVRNLAEMFEMRGRTTRGHYVRVAELALQLSDGLAQYDPSRRQRLEYAAWLHDIGKLGIPERILQKSGPLSSYEEKLLRDHPALGASLVGAVEMLKDVAPLIRHHHERWDGHGYPDGLAGEAIPEESRIIAIVNAYDGLLTERRGRPGLSPMAALAQIHSNAGKIYDPHLVERFTAQIAPESLVAPTR
jgi:diguanylate cyclase (GGDEF)-like protein